MTTTETTLGQQPDVRGEPLEPPPSTWLPLTAGDDPRTGDAEKPEHEWPGSLFVFLTNFAAFGLGAAAVFAAGGIILGLESAQQPFAGITLLGAIGLALGSVVQRALAKHVKNFSRWGWWGAMAELGLATLSKVNVVVHEPSAIAGIGIGIIIDLLWMRYFWERRADFDIDLNI